VELILRAMLNKEIAFELCLSEGTIKEYLHTIFRKLGVKNRTELAVWASLCRNPAQVLALKRNGTEHESS
jgi:DNA-binding NarL/FixJ family response regulator